MRITHEADYAIRIVYTLSVIEAGKHLGASALAEQSGITQRFALKILRKLMIGGLVVSFKGANGGYALKKPITDISIGEVIELIDGPIQINHCLDSGFDCTRVPDKVSCGFHNMFNAMNVKFCDELHKMTFDMFSQPQRR